MNGRVGGWMGGWMMGVCQKARYMNGGCLVSFYLRAFAFGVLSIWIIL